MRWTGRKPCGERMTIVILAAGTARRMGRQKLLLPVDGRSIVERVIDAARAWPTVIVTSAQVTQLLDPAALRIVRNDAPDRGMSHSLKLANATIDPIEPIAVVLGDLPDITAQAIAGVVRAYDDTIDVVVPRCGDAFAHPVVFGPRARRKIEALPDGDTIKHLRDDPGLARRFVDGDQSALIDVDTPSDYARRIAAAESSQ